MLNKDVKAEKNSKFGKWYLLIPVVGYFLGITKRTNSEIPAHIMAGILVENILVYAVLGSIIFILHVSLIKLFLISVLALMAVPIEKILIEITKLKLFNWNNVYASKLFPYNYYFVQYQALSFLLLGYITSSFISTL
jgi:hypothetical protein